MAANDKSLRIACRLVCRDQWLVTHVDPSWPVSTLKLFLLHKFTRTATDPDYNPRAIPVSPRKARRRSLSPITFAPPPLRKAQPSHPSISAAAEHGDSDDSGDLDFDDDVNITKAFTDAHRYKYTARPSTSSVSESAPLPSDAKPKHDPNAYVLLTFSTTQILEDRFNLQWYGIHPGELLELHPAGVSFVSLPRSTLDAYIAPYFAARVWALRIVGHGSDDREDEGNEPGRQSGREKRERKKIAVEWKERWAIVHQGVFSLCKERHDTHVAFSCPLSSMLSIRDSAHFNLPLHTARLRRKSTVTPTGSNVVCVKFRTGTRQDRPFPHDSSVTFESTSQDRRDPSTPALGVSTTISAGTVPASGSGSGFGSGGQGAWWRKGSRDVSGALSIGLTSSASALVGAPMIISNSGGTFGRRGSAAGLEESEGESVAKREKGKGKEKEKDEAEEAVWIVLDMLDSSACSHILRILHRHAPPQCHSTFLPNRGAEAYSPSPSPIIFSTRSSSPGSPTTPGPSSSHTISLPPSHNSPQPSTLLFPTPTGACSSYIPYKAYHFGGPSSDARPPSPTLLPRPGHSLSDLVTAELGRGEGVPYPSWRLELVRKARRAGLGAVGRAMELVMFGDEEGEDGDFAGEDEDEEDLAIEWAREKRNTMSSFAPSPVVDQPVGRARAPWTPREVGEMVEMPAADEDVDEEYVDATDEDEVEVEDETPPGGKGEGEEEETLQSQQHYAPRWFEDLSYLEDPELEPPAQSDGSEAEWDGWVDAVVSQYRQESLARRAQARREALAASGALDTPLSGPGPSAQAWTEAWSSRFGEASSTSTAAADREREDDNDNAYDELGTWTWPSKNSRNRYQRGKESDVDVDGSTEDSSDPSASPTPCNARFARGSKSRGQRGHGHTHWGGTGRTLSSYSSVDSLLRRTATMRSNIKSMSLSGMRRSSFQALFPSASSSNIHLARQDVGGSPSPPPRANSSNPSIASTRTVRAVSTGSASASANPRNRPLSPLSTQVPGGADDQFQFPDAGEDGDVDDELADVDDIDEHGADDAAELYESEVGHGYQRAQHHPVPLPGMQFVPSGYTTFRHNSLYGQERWARGETARGRGGTGQKEAPAHAGIAHGENMQRLPLPMGMAQMMTTVSSTVSVGPSGRRSGR